MNPDPSICCKECQMRESGVSKTAYHPDCNACEAACRIDSVKRTKGNRAEAIFDLMFEILSKRAT